MVVVREKHGVPLIQAESAIRGLTLEQIRQKASSLSAQYKAQLPLNFGVDRNVTIKHLQTPEGLTAQRILGLANWLVDYLTHGNSFISFISTPQDIGGFQEVPPKSINGDDQITTTDEIQFLHAPTDTFESIGVQGSPPPPSPLPEPTGRLFLKMNQVVFPQISETFSGINGTVNFVLVVDPRVLGVAGRAYTFRILVHNLTGSNRTERKINFDITQTRTEKRIKYLVAIPAGARRIRIELQAFTPDGKPASNVFNESHIKKPDEPTPDDFKTCQCIDPNTGEITRGKTIPVGEVCPECKLPPPPPPPLDGLIPKIVMGALILGAVLPLGGKKK